MLFQSTKEEFKLIANAQNVTAVISFQSTKEEFKHAKPDLEG